MSLSQEQIDQINEIADKFYLELYMPPLQMQIHHGSMPFFKIKDVKQDSIKFKEFLMAVKEAGVDYEFVASRGETEKDYIKITNKGDK